LVNIAYPGGQIVRVPAGFAVLDASRRAGVPHASVCGGRGRCSTCRIRVLRGFDRLPVASRSETAVLMRLRVGPTVRLACQLRPRGDIAVLPLLPPDIGADDRRRRGTLGGDRERFVAILFVDIRQSTALVEDRLPYDVVFILNHFFEAVGGAVVAVGGAPNQFIGDGMMALFGIDCAPREACRQALAAARGEIGYGERFLMTAIGDAVHVAARLQDLTKDYQCQIVVSEAVGIAAEIDLAAFADHEVHVRGRAAPLTVRVIRAAASLVS
jgi:adenylate cyclase